MKIFALTPKGSVKACFENETVALVITKMVREFKILS